MVRDTGDVTIKQLRARRTEIERTAREFGASNIRVFGSVARGDAGPDSDVDLLVDMERGRGLLALAGLELALERLLGSDVDVTTPGGLKPRVREAVLVEARPL